MQSLEDRFLGLIEPKLAAAFSQKNGERVQQLSGMLMSIHCHGTVEKLYNTARMAPLQVVQQQPCMSAYSGLHISQCALYCYLGFEVPSSPYFRYFQLVLDPKWIRVPACLAACVMKLVEADM